MTNSFVLGAIVFALAGLSSEVAPVAGGEFTPILPIHPRAIVGNSEAVPGGAWDVTHLVDGQLQTEYASKGKGVQTHVDFDFGRPVAVAGFKHIDRNDVATARAARLIFSQQPDFSSQVGSAAVKHADQRGGTTLVTFPAITARYVRWQVTEINAQDAACIGGKEICFFTTAARDPLPSRDQVIIQPEQILLRRNGRQVQLVTITVDHRYAEDTEASLEVDGLASIPLKLSLGKQTQEVTLPAVQADAPLRAILKVSDQEAARGQVVRQPVRPWTVYLLPHSHVDIGYTAIQPDVERKQIINLNMAMRLARETAGYPEAARFKWNVEVMWPVECYLRRATPEERQALFDAIKAGHIGLNALYGNMLTGLCRPEELMHMMDYGLEVSRRCSVPLESAMISDVPGYAWGTVVAMVQAGVKYFSFGPNWFGRMGYTMATWQDKPFYWETPDGRHRVLCWCPRTGYALGHVIGDSPALEEYLPRYLRERVKEGYAYDITHLRWTIHGDNGPPDKGLSDVVRKWNEEHVSPKLVIATAAMAFREFEERYGAELPVFRGDYTPYWEDGAASSALETALNRASAERLVQAETLWAMLYPNRRRFRDFYEAWRNVLLYDEHTWGAYNSVIAPDLPFVRTQWRIKHSFAADADRESRELLAEAVYSPGIAIPNPDAHGQTIVVYNTNSWPRTDLVILPRELRSAGDRVEDLSGGAVPSQRLAAGELAFLAADVPPLAGKTFVVKRGDRPAETHLRVDGSTLAGADLTVKIDGTTGGIASLRSCRLGAEFVDQDAAAAVNDYFYLLGNDLKKLQRNGPVTISVKESGPLVVSLLIESDAPGCNQLSREVRLIDGLDRVEIINRVAKKPVREKEGVHFGFAFDVPDAQIRLDVGWAVIRPNKDQIPGSCRNWFCVQRFVDVSNEHLGVTLATLDAPIVEIGRITGTLVGSSSASAEYLYHDTKAWMDRSFESPPIYSFVMNNHWGTNYRADQQGLVEFRYAIRPHARYRPSEAVRFGVQCSQPLRATVATEPAPPEPRLTVRPPGVIVTSLRPSRDGKAMIARLYAASGNAEQATIRWAAPAPKSVWLSDLSERPLEAVTGSVDIPAWGVVTLRAELREWTRDGRRFSRGL